MRDAKGQPVRYQRPAPSPVREVLRYVEPAPPECLAAGETCEHCRHWISDGAKCGLFKAAGGESQVKPDAYCVGFVS